MNYLTQKLLNKEETNSIRNNINKDKELWEDGKKTAGSLAAESKNNLQLSKKSELSKYYSKLISEEMAEIQELNEKL